LGGYLGIRHSAPVAVANRATDPHSLG
jgi:hypothetical protein